MTGHFKLLMIAITILLLLNHLPINGDLELAKIFIQV